MSKLIIETKPHEEQRYETCGDWFTDQSGDKHIVVSAMGNPDYEMLVAVHELIEQYLCERRGISQDSVDKFDREFEAARQLGNDDEPGDDPSAPYYKEHRFASSVERIIAAELGVNWKDYDKTVVALSQKDAQDKE